MTSGTITGSCLCGSIGFELEPPFAAFRYCHCSRCQKASGSAHASNAFVPTKQFRWTSGENLIKRFDLSGAERFAVCFCPQCGTRMPHAVKSTENMLIPAGVLDVDPGVRPSNSIFWKSQAAWYVPPTELPHVDEYK